MVVKFFLIGLAIVIGAAALAGLLTNPANDSTLYENLIDGELAHQPDGTYQRAIVVISRDGLNDGVIERVQDAYARSGVKIQFVAGPSDLTPAYLAGLARTQSLPVHGFIFQPINYREGTPGLDYQHLTSTGGQSSYTVQLRLSGANAWQIVQKTVSTTF